MTQPEVLSVSQLNQRARHLLEDVFPAIVVEGEISNLARPASGHLYFTLKDAGAQVRCAFFRQNAQRTRQQAENGTLVRVTGRLSIYEGRGDYQLIVSQLEAGGEGALRAAFEALKQRLLDEGLFAAERKQPLPRFPRRIGLVTSASGAVLRDIISVFARRAPHIELVLVATAVQGKEATAQIVTALQRADRAGFDAIILARGGGSLEDLWCFNEESVARCLAGLATPVVSAIGHETDTSISDFVADVRAPTPTAAAELLSPDRQQLLELLRSQQLRLQRRMQVLLQHGQLQLDSCQRRLRHPRERIEQNMQRLDELYLRMLRSIRHQQDQQLQRLQHLQRALNGKQLQTRLLQQHAQLDGLQQRLRRSLLQTLEQRQQQFHQQVQALQLVSPLATLERGYAIVRDDQQRVIHSVTQTAPGQPLSARLADGTLELQVLAVQPS